MPARGGDHGAPFVNGLGQRLFDIDILPRLAGQDGRQRMPVIRRGDDDGVEVFAFEDATEILLRCGCLAAFAGANLHAGGEVLVVHDRRPRGTRLRDYRGRIAGPGTLPAAADEADADLVIRAGFAGAD